MPRLVDHAERRRAIVSAAWRLIADRGIDAVTMRELAAEAGYTNGALGHYFSGKDEIMRTTYDFILDESDRRIRDSVRDETGLSALRTMCRALMPLTEETLLEARVAVSLWKWALTDSVARQANNTAVNRWRGEMASHLTEARDAGELIDIDPGRGADIVTTTLVGLQITAVLDPASTSPSDQVAMLDALLDGWRRTP